MMPPKRQKKKKLKDALKAELLVLSDAAKVCRRDDRSGASCDVPITSSTFVSSGLSLSPPRTELLYMNKSSHNYSSMCNLRVLFQTSYYDDGDSSDNLKYCDVETQTTDKTRSLISSGANTQPKISPNEVSFFTPQLYVRKPSSTPILEREQKGKSSGSARNRWETPKLCRTVRRRSFGGSTPRRQSKKMKKSLPSPTTKTPPSALTEFLKKLWFEVKRFARVAFEVLKMVARVGIVIKTGLFSFLYVYLKKSVPEGDRCECKCEQYGEEIKQLNNKMAALQDEFENRQRLQEVRFRDEVTDLRRELDGIKIRLEENARKVPEVVNSSTSIQAAAPPPPPPPMPTLLFSATNTCLAPIKKKHGAKDADKNKRPVISLEEILNVRLRKTADRSPYARRSTVPCIQQQEFLKEVKLRRTVKPPTPALPDASNSSSNDSLIRLLTSSDNSVRRVKRLKRPDGYSFDDISRRNALARRERERM